MLIELLQSTNFHLHQPPQNTNAALKKRPMFPPSSQIFPSLFPRLVPALVGGPGYIFGHFSCRRPSVVRVFNAAKHGKTRKSPADRTLSHRISGMNRRIEESEQIPHTRTPFRSVVFARFLENSIHNMCLLGTKFRTKNDDAARNFALIGGRCWGGYEQNTQQSTT